MKKWEYDWDEPRNMAEHQESLIKRGEKGWELVSVLMVNTLDTEMRFYWKREIIDEINKTK